MNGRFVWVFLSLLWVSCGGDSPAVPSAGLDVEEFQDTSSSIVSDVVASVDLSSNPDAGATQDQGGNNAQDSQQSTATDVVIDTADTSLPQSDTGIPDGADIQEVVDAGSEPVVDPCDACVPGTYCTPAGECLEDTTCAEMECGLAPGAGFCGFCSPGVSCTDEGACVENCLWDCDGKQCGSNGCGGQCASCIIEGTICSPTGQCVVPELCVPECEGKECGDDGCGGSCGGCSNGLLCTTQNQCGNECTECGFSTPCLNFGFESGNIMDGRFEGQVLVLDQFGITSAPEGNKFIKVSNADEYKGIAQIQTCVPPETNGLKFLWKMYSEEFLEFCYSDYTDFVRVTVYVAGAEDLDETNSVVFERNIQQICPAGECQDCGDFGQMLIQAQVIFDIGGVYTGPWTQEYLDISNIVAPEGPTVLTVEFRVEDVGDSVYDTRALFDQVQFTTECVPSCDGKMCGDDGCGGSCGACFDGGSGCDDGNQCCASNCFGKQCGPDGCGGSCGGCWEGLLCLTGNCIEEKDAFGVPCNPETDSCGGSFECVDLGETGILCDLICDLAQDFCPPGWSCGSWPGAENPVCLPD